MSVPKTPVYLSRDELRFLLDEMAYQSDQTNSIDRMERFRKLEVRFSEALDDMDNP